MKQPSAVGLFCLAAFAAPTAAFAAQGAQRLLYTVPNSTFIENQAGDQVVTLNDTTGSIASVQSAIDSARSANPGAIIVARLARGMTYSVSSAGLTLRTRMALVAEGAVIRASSASVTVPLVTIASGSTKVSVAGGTLDGNGADIRGIEVLAASRVNIDRVTVADCRLEGIRLNGNGNTVYNNEMTVTRCEVSGTAGGAGISTQNSTQTVMIDNYSHHNATGIRVAGAWASVVNNTVTNNGIGIDVAGNDNIVGNNTADANATGLRAGGTNGMIVSNALAGNTTVGMASTGTSNNILDNRFGSGNASLFSNGGTTNRIVAYRNGLGASGQNYFYPPLIDNQHTNTTIVNGMGRTDITVGSGSLSTVQTQYNNARAANPNNVIVLHMNGTFTVGASPLTLSSNTCVLLSGTVQINSATTATSAFRVSSQTRVSISGGVLDGGNRTGRKGVHASGSSMIQVDAMNIRNFGDNADHHGSSESIHYSGGSTPYVVTRCNIDKAGSRGIWAQTSGQKQLYSDNTVRLTRSCIDADSHTFGSVMLFNRCYDNTYGLFIEQGASYNTAIGNVVNNSTRRNIEIYNNNNTPPVRYSTIVANTLVGSTGIRNGSTPDGSLTSWNFMFNNVFLGSRLAADPAGEENYYSQNWLDGASTMTLSGTQTFFNSPDVEAHQYVQDAASGLAVVVEGGSTAAGAAVVTGTASAAGEGEWQVVPVEGGYVRVQNRRSGLVLAVSGASLAAGAEVVQSPYTADATSNDEWLVRAAPGGLYNLVNRRSGLSLEVTGGGGAGTQLTQQTGSGAAYQRFRLTENAPGGATPTPTPTPTPTLAPTLTPTPTPFLTPTPTPTTPAGGFVEITPGAAAVTASTHDGNLPANAVDNSVSTRWSANGDGQWLRFDLGATRTLARVAIAVYNGNARQNRFDLQVSSDGGSWTDVLTAAVTSGTTTAEEVHDFADVATRYVRYVGHGSTVGTFNSVTEVSLFEPSGVPPTPTPTPLLTPTPTATPAVTPTATPTATPPGLGGFYRLMARHSGKAVAVQGASTADGGNVVQWTYAGTTANDEWELRGIGGGYYRVVNRHSGKDLIVAGAATANAADVVQWTYGGAATNDEWQPIDLGNGYHRLVNRNSGKVLNVAGAGTADGANVDQWAWANVNQQQFQLVSIP